MYALITGASKGIGKSIAFQLAAKGYNLVLVARNEASLADLAEVLSKRFNITVKYQIVDLQQPGAAEQLYTFCTNEQLPVSVLVNNAGRGSWGRFDELALAEQHQMMQLNMHALVDLTHYFLPMLKQQQTAYILNVASTAAYQAMPTMAIYAATKSFVVSFSRALKRELKNSSVSVSCLSPGPTDTHFIETAGMQALKEKAAKYEMTPDEVAKIAVKGMFAKKTEIIPGFLNAFSAFMLRFVPKSTPEKVVEKVYRVN